jgi:hypothetical protein
VTVRVLGPHTTDWVEGRRVLTAPLRVDLGRRVLGLEQWALDRKLVTHVHYHVFSTAIVVPKGFDYDGASIPWWSAPIMGAKENYEIAGCLHDALYRWQAPRDLADYVFWLVARSGHKRVGPVRAYLGWAALRVGGRFAYRQYAS